MTLGSFLEAARARLQTLWPDRTVYTDPPPENANDYFRLGLLKSQESAGLGPRRKRRMQFEIAYHLSPGDQTKFLEWAETMYEMFCFLDVEEFPGQARPVRLTNPRAQKGDGPDSFRFLFGAEVNRVLAEEPGEPMERLGLEEGMKE